MARNGSGTYSLPAGNPVTTGTTISSTWANNTLTDIATAMTDSIAKDGQTTPTANLPLGGFKITGLGAGTAATDAARVGNIQNATGTILTPAGADTITATASPTLTAYAAGQTFRFVAAGTNTGAVTLNIDTLGAKAVTKFGTTALAANDIQSGQEVEVVYDGTRFQMTAPRLAASYAMSTAKMLGRTTASTGAVEEISVGSGLSLAAGVLSNTGGYDFSGTATNYIISCSRVGNAETIALKTKAGTDPSASDPVTLNFRNVTAATGDYSTISITAATSITISSGSTLGMINNVSARVVLVGFNDGGTFRLGVINQDGKAFVVDQSIGSSTAEGGAGAADAAATFYTGTAVTSKAYRVLGYLDYSLATVGTWITAPTTIQLLSPGQPVSPANTVIAAVTASTSGTAIDFTGIPAGVHEIIIAFKGVSTGGTGSYYVRIGDSGGIVSTAYLAGTAGISNGSTGNSVVDTTAFILSNASVAARTYDGIIRIVRQDPATNTYVSAGLICDSSPVGWMSTGYRALTGMLDRVRILTSAGDTFDLGSISLSYRY